MARNPFTLWQSYVGAVLGGLIPVPMVFAILPNAFLFKVGFPYLLIPLAFITSGFFFGAASRRGKDGFFKFGAIAFLVALALYYLIFFTSVGGPQQ